MRKILIVLSLLISLASIYWGAKLIFDSYMLGKESTFLLKSGTTELSTDAIALHPNQSVKSLVVHLGLIIFGVSLITYICTSKRGK